MLISFGLFICFMGYFVVKINTDPDLKHHLVTPSYYQEELKENQKNIALNNAKTWADHLDHKNDEKHLILYPLPQNQKFSVIGYRPSDPEKDFLIAVKSEKDSDTIRLDPFLFDQGVWKLSIQWEVMDKAYRVDYKLTIE